jgi:predicted RNA binding protein YcfA (HicA-like mRNA interferase family)
MPSPIPLKLVLKVLRKKDFFFVSQSGSHAKYKKTGIRTRNTIIPIHGKEIPYRTFKSILRQTNLNENDFRK